MKEVVNNLDPEEDDPHWVAYQESERLRKNAERERLSKIDFFAPVHLEYTCKRSTCGKDVNADFNYLMAAALRNSKLCPECYEEYIASERGSS